MFKLLIYYIFLYKLPSARFVPIFSKIRALYFEKVFKILEVSENPSMIGPNVYIRKAKNISIGAGARINENVYIEDAEIGENVLIAPNVVLLSRMHEHKNIDIPIALQGYRKEKKVTIANNVWLGRNVIVMPGVKIGEGTIVAAGAVVTQSQPDFCIVGGVPAKVIKSRIPKN